MIPALLVQLSRLEMRLNTTERHNAGITTSSCLVQTEQSCYLSKCNYSPSEVLAAGQPTSSLLNVSPHPIS